MPLPQERLGKNLREHRLRLGLTQEQLGHKAGLHFTEIGRLERGVRDPRLSTISKLAKALGVTVAELATDV